MEHTQSKLKMMIWLPQGINQVIEWKMQINTNATFSVLLRKVFQFFPIPFLFPFAILLRMIYCMEMIDFSIEKRMYN